MGCACGKRSVRSGAGAQAAARQSGSGSAYEYEVNFSDGTTARVPSEVEAIAALRHTGGGYREVLRGE